MPRANRHYIPGHIWHITHRCHDRQFLLKVEEDRNRWCYWACQARKRFGLTALDYCVTCNHVHLLVIDECKDDEVIPRSMQLIAGRTAQEYNDRKGRRGAFWEDRYHATAVETGEHLLRRIAYIDLNMVRAGAVSHPRDWEHGGYRHIQQGRRRNWIVDHEAVTRLWNVDGFDNLQLHHRDFVDQAMESGGLVRDGMWTDAVAVGGKSFVEGIQERLGKRVQGRGVVDGGHSAFMLREPCDAVYGGESIAGYGPDFGAQTRCLEGENTVPWKVFPEESIN